MIPIADIPDEELQRDFESSLDDILICVEALNNGIGVYSGGPVVVRLTNNVGFVRTIVEEMLRRAADQRLPS